MIRKVTALAAVLRRDPQEFADRVRAIAQGRLDAWLHDRPPYTTTAWHEFVKRMDACFDGAFSRALRDDALSATAVEVRSRVDALRGGPIDDRHNADELLARCCYAVVRCVQPAVVVETGVAHGVSSAYLLAALAENGVGEMHSIDLPPHDSGAEDRIGAAVPERLRSRWHLHRGMSRRLLPTVLSRVGGADVFVHDSLHTYENMRFELAMAHGARVVLVDDIQLNHAFAEAGAHANVMHAALQQAEKEALFGVLVR